MNIKDSGTKAGTRKIRPQVLARASRIEGELLVRFRAEARSDNITSIVEANGAHRVNRLRGNSRIIRLNVATGHDQDVVMAGLSANPNVEFVEPNYIISQDSVGPTNPRFAEPLTLPDSTGAGVTHSSILQPTTGSWHTIIAVIDSGVDFSHPDLRNNQWTDINERLDGADDDHDGYLDDVNGWDWITNTNEIKDQSGHGTGIAGIIAGHGNNSAGVMQEAGLMSLRVLDGNGLGTVADAVEAIDYATKHGAQVINCSWGTDGNSIALREAIKRAGLKGAVVVASAGNNGQSIDSQPHFPASYDIPNLISIAGANGGSQLANWTNWSVNHSTIAAPGDHILTTKMGGGYQNVSGTSAAAAYVSGVAGLIKTSRSALGGKEVRDIIISKATPVAAMTGKVKAGGVVNVTDALARAKTVFTDDDPDTIKPQTNNDNNQRSVASETSFQSVPGFNLPDLDVQRKINPAQPKAIAPVPSTLCSLDDCNPRSDARTRFPQSENDSSFNWEEQTPAPVISGVTPDGEAESNKLLGEVTNSADFAAGLISSRNRSNVNRWFGALGESAPFYSTSDNFSEERLDPSNRTGAGGEDVFSGNYSWGVPLVGLKGRAGLDLSIGLSYNSLVWTKSGSTIGFDADHGFPTPGFRLGFPVIEPVFTSSVTGVSTLLMVTSSGARVEFRLVDGSGHYEAVDSSYGQLTNNGDGTLSLRTASGMKMTYTLHNSTGYDCTEIKDRNGNYITISYDTYRHITTIVDTLNRTITFNYDINHNPTSITQTWGSSTTHTWATFGYTTLTISTNFTSLSLSGITNGTTINVLSQVGLSDGSYYTFTYGSWGQVYTITNYAADAHELSHVTYNLPTTNSTAATDCPRFTTRSDTAENWNGGSAVTTSYSISTGQSWTKLDTTSDSGTLEQTTAPNGTIYKTYSHSSGWDKGLPRLQETWSDSSTKQRSVFTDYTQDNTGVYYIQNPRVTETNIKDSSNRKRTTISYSNFTLPDGQVVYLPSDTYEYQSDASTVLRRSHTDYVTDSGYLSWHVLGLPSAQYVYEGSSTVLAHVGYVYDESGQISTQTATHHDDTNYSTSFLTRGNVDKIRRYDKTNSSVYLDTVIAYNTDGSVLSTTDPLSHSSTISYTDSFSDSTNHSTYAFPTTVTDADSNSSTIVYNYDFGGVTKTHNPKSAEMLTTYDSVGRVSQNTYHDGINNVDGTYIRYVYPTSQNIVQSYSLLSSGGSEAYSVTLMDGAGRVYAMASDHPGSTGGYKGQKTVYNTMGRVYQRSNPTEMNSSWTASGDDATAGWLYASQTYDWKGRPLVSTNTDTTQKSNSYAGCGCAGGEVVTSTDEGGRQRKVTSDVLGRAYKTEILNWNGTTYSRSTATLNALDQVTQIIDLDAGTSTSQTTTINYDNYGRVSSKHLPVYDTSATTSYSYNNDDSVHSVTDPRGASKTMTYNARGLLTAVSYSVPSGVTSTAGLSFTYDAAGNRTQMTDGLGTVSYSYDTWSRITSEIRSITELSTSYTISYAYNLAGQLTQITDPFSAHVDYVRDKTGRVTEVDGTGYTDNVTSVPVFASSIGYRAWNGVKGLTYGNGKSLTLDYNSRLEMTSFQISGVRQYQYQYGDDGKISQVTDQIDNRFNRSYIYDHAGRLQEARSGAEVANPSASWTGPYRQYFQYTGFNNMKIRSGRYWSQDLDSTAAVYTNNRRSDWSYDAAGNVTLDDTGNSPYDANGRKTSLHIQGDTSAIDINLTYDGDGNSVKRYEISQLDDQTIFTPTYYIRSTVLGGQVLVEVDSPGCTYGCVVSPSWFGYAVSIFGDGQLLAKSHHSSSSHTVYFQHNDPVTGSQMLSNYSGSWSGAEVEHDPMGAETLTFDPYTYYDSPTYLDTASGPLYTNGGDPFRPYSGCSLDGISIDCKSVKALMEGEAAMPKGATEFMYLGIGLFVAKFPDSRTVYDQEEDRYRLADEDIAFTFGGGAGGRKDLPCITASKLVQDPKVKAALDAARKATLDSGEYQQYDLKENGGFIFLNRSTGEIEIVKGPQGTNTGKGASREVAWTGAEEAYYKTVEDFKKAGKDMSLMMVYHTHPGPGVYDYGHYADLFEPDILKKWAGVRDTAAMGLILDDHGPSHKDAGDNFYDSWSITLYPDIPAHKANLEEVCLGLTDLKWQLETYKRR